MRVVSRDMRERIEFGMAAAADRLVRLESSPLVMGGTIGLVVFVGENGPEPYFVANWQYSQDFDESGFDRDVWLSLASSLEETAHDIRIGHLDDFLLPRVKPDVDGTA